VLKATTELHDQLCVYAISDPSSPLYGRATAEVTAREGTLVLRDDSSRQFSYGEILRRQNLPKMEVIATAKTADDVDKEKKSDEAKTFDRESNDDEKKYAFQSFGAQFVEVSVDPDLGEVRVRRVRSAFDVGRILNDKTARSQAIGGIVMGIGMALMEKTVLDLNRGRIMTRNLADYLVPVHADMADIEVIFTEKPDLHLIRSGVAG